MNRLQIHGMMSGVLGLTRLSSSLERRFALGKGSWSGSGTHPSGFLGWSSDLAGEFLQEGFVLDGIFERESEHEDVGLRDELERLQE